MEYELTIIGGGPAAIAAGVYAARKKINTVLITDFFGGQSVVSESIQNWIGTQAISGFDLAKNLETHLKSQQGIVIKEGDRVQSVKKVEGGFAVTTEVGASWTTKTILLSTGSRHRRLEIPGEKKFEGHGVVYCATCDAPLFQGKRVAVIGGGNSGLEAAVDLFPYATEIYLLHRNASLKGDPITQEKVRTHPHAQILLNAEPVEIVGDTAVTELRYMDKTTGEKKSIAVEGVFVEVGSVPNVELVKDFVTINPYGYIVVDHRTQATSCPGIWAAGDVSDGLYKQNNISVAEGIQAILNIFETLRTKGESM